MLRVQAGHYRDSFRGIVYDVYKVRAGVWSFRAVGNNAIGLNLGMYRECETKEATVRRARLSITVALEEREQVQ